MAEKRARIAGELKSCAHVSAGRDVNLVAGILQSQGGVGITAGNNINLSTVSTTQSANSVRDARNFVRSSQSQEVGSQITSQGPLTLSAGNNINATAASLQSQQDVQLTAADNVTLSAGRVTSNFEDAQFAQSRGLLSSSSQTSRVTQNSSQAIGTSIGGNTVSIASGNDINVKGSSVISDSATTLVAGNSSGNGGGFSASQSKIDSNFKSVGQQSGIKAGEGGFQVTVNNDTDLKGALDWTSGRFFKEPHQDRARKEAGDSKGFSH